MDQTITLSGIEFKAMPCMSPFGGTLYGVIDRGYAYRLYRNPKIQAFYADKSDLGCPWEAIEPGESYYSMELAAEAIKAHMGGAR